MKNQHITRNNVARPYGVDLKTKNLVLPVTAFEFGNCVSLKDLAALTGMYDRCINAHLRGIPVFVHFDFEGLHFEDVADAFCFWEFPSVDGTLSPCRANDCERCPLYEGHCPDCGTKLGLTEAAKWRRGFMSWACPSCKNDRCVCRVLAARYDKLEKRLPKLS